MKRNVNRRCLNPGSSQTRRDFARRLAQLLAFGGLSHFAIKNVAKAATSKDEAHEDCPGGGPAADACTPPSDYDYCPGEIAPSDECPNDGNRDEDECNSGLMAADVCDDAIKSSDQCSSGLKEDDLCSDNDFCPTGRNKSDECAADGGIADGDECPGGGAELDTCDEKQKGDECGMGTWGPEDDCNNSHTDEFATTHPISPFEDDSCFNGTNVEWSALPNGGEDWCLGNLVASDDCTTGEDSEDLCASNSSNNGDFDTCPGGNSSVDKCDDDSEDSCVTGVENSDSCEDGKPQEDACADGNSSEDTCYMHTPNSDECNPVVSGSDQGGCKSFWDDNCFVFDKCNINQKQDIAE